MLTAEVLVTGRESRRGTAMLHAMVNAAQSAGVRVQLSSEYRGDCDWLMLYGVGGIDRLPAYTEHRTRRKRTITWDVGYWNRSNTLRVSIDDMHPQKWLGRAPKDSTRFDPAGIHLTEVFNPKGRIIFAAMGPKSRTLYGDWDQREFDKVSRLGRPILFREKPPSSKADVPSFESLLPGTSLVVCHHSNVAIDCAIWGVPCVCVDGAGAALWPSTLREAYLPSPEKRREFLTNLSWFQWLPQEAAQAWEFLRGVTGD